MATREAILHIVNERGTIANTRDLVDEKGWDHDQLVGSMKSLQAREMIVVETHVLSSWLPSADGETVLAEGSPEFRVFLSVSEPISQKDLEARFGADLVKIGMNNCMKNKWLRVDKASKLVTRCIEETPVDQIANQLRSLDSASEATIKLLKSRHLIVQQTRNAYSIAKGEKFSLTLPELTTDITTEMIQKGTWNTVEFKPYNFQRGVEGKRPKAGALNALLRSRAMYRQIFLEMGFAEMPTNNYVESSFWNFDALFQPQQHPARDAHDTFFLSDPAETTTIPADYMERVKSMHENGGNGSIGWRYDWKEKEARKNLLRTHTTAVSSRMLYALAQEKEFTAKKYFSIDRVFRNETPDATHLAEFSQIEGLVADYNLTLGNLMGIIREFFQKLGIPKIKFKPAYNPYTEPSMEIFSWHEGHQRWLEIGNSGMFRPEMLSPMGLPEGVRVIAWGLSLERPTMIRYGISNIRTLVGHKIDLKQLENAPLCRVAKKNPEATSTSSSSSSTSA